MATKLKILNLGWGIQSWTMAAMCALDELPRPDFVIHSDTGWEHRQTYEFARQQTGWLIERGVKVTTVGDNLQSAKVTGENTDIPAFTSTAGRGGQLRRQCTGRWKIQPIRRFISQELAGRAVRKTPGVVEQWLGITTDEFMRAKSSDVKYIINRYPLLDLGMSRGDCVAWLNSRRLPIPPKSSCVFCPYKNRRSWEELKREGGQDWETTLAVDTAIRKVRPPHDLFVHPARVPLEDAVVIPEDFGMQQAGFNLDEAPCDSGHCFL